MRIKNRLSPYPILDNFGDDYINSSFSVEYDVDTQFTEVYGKLTFKLENDDIKKLINNNQAEYLVHIECPATCYRTAKRTNEDIVEFKINSQKLAKVIEIRTFIVLKQDVKNFASSKFHPDYANQTFDLNAHQIIAIGTGMDYSIHKDDRDLDSLPSILQIQRLTDKKKGSLTVNTDSDDRIIVGLAEETYDLYASLGKSAFKAASFSLVLLPALVVVIQRMHMGKDDTDLNTRHWFIVIDSMLKKNGFSLDKIKIDDDSLLSVCQSIFADPIARSFSELNFFSERSE